MFHPRMQMNRVIENIRTTKRTAQMYFIQGSWTRENVGFTIAKSDSPRVLRFRNHVQNGHDLCKGQNRVDVQGGYINVAVYGSMLQYFKQRKQRHSLKLGKKRRQSSKLN